jgi:primosomal protein N' (replication factor Y) (superfamily II helicase)
MPPWRYWCSFGLSHQVAIAKIITDLALDREFDYLIPAELGDRVRIGSVVRVPFGRRRARGFVTGLADRPIFRA